MNQDWERWGRDIRNIVEDAVESQDFRKLNDTISNTVNDAVFTIKENLRMAGRGPGYGPVPGRDFDPMAGMEFGSVTEGTQNHYKSMEEVYSQKNLQLFKKRTGMRALGIFVAVLGIWITVPCVLVLSVGLFQFIREGIDPAGIAALILLALFVLCGICIIRAGTGLSGRVGRYKQYIRSLQGRAYCNVSDLSQRTGIKKKRIIKDLRKMIRDRWFLQGHLDDQETCLMVTDKAYQEYRDICMRRAQERSGEEDPAHQKPSGEQTKAEQVLEKGRWYIQKIRQCNDDIPGVEISRKIDRIELLIRRIFDRVEQDADTVEDIRKLMDYYLPTTVKLLEAYVQLDDQPQAGENIRQAKKEIEKTLDTLNTAFEKLLDSLFEDVAWDISSDISVLEAMLAQEGLTEDDLKRKE